MRRFLCLICLFLAACSPQSVDMAATIVAGVALTDTALAPTATLTSTPTPEPTATSTLPPSPTPAPTASPTLLPNARRIAYGDSASYAPRGGEVWVYAFDGSEADSVAVTVVVSNAHAGPGICSNFSSTATHIVKTNAGEALVPDSPGAAPYQQNYILPRTGPYYVEVRCSGQHCNGWCAQVDTTLQLNP